MLTLVNILILFFVFIILYQIFLATNIIEGLENQYQSYDTNNPANAMILSQQNAGNIAYIKERLDEYQGLSKEVQDISGNYASIQSQVDQLVQAQQQYTTQMTGGTVPEISGAVPDETSDESSSTSLAT
jgi:hypothetical protein